MFYSFIWHIYSMFNFWSVEGTKCIAQLVHSITCKACLYGSGMPTQLDAVAEVSYINVYSCNSSELTINLPVTTS